MKLTVFDSTFKLAEAAAIDAARMIRKAIDDRGRAYVIAATGSSQFDFLNALAQRTEVNWAQTTFFHLDEYVGLPASHPASFRNYLKERIVEPLAPGAFHFINGDAADPVAECSRVGELISRQPIDVAFVGIGENSHLAFNDPPANFITNEPYLVVELNEACRRQQVGEGWFKSIDEVPPAAISMSIQQILKTQNILCVVPDRRKAQAVKDCLELDVSPWRPASILRQHSNTTIYLDRDSASLLKSDDYIR